MFDQIWIIYLRELIMQSFVCRPHWTELCQNVISQENNSQLTLYTNFHNLKIFLDDPVDQVQS